MEKLSAPLMWDTTRSVHENTAIVQSYVTTYEKFIGVQIDEASLLSPNQWEASALCETLGKVGWEEFNRASDHVNTRPMSTHYAVEYIFLKHADVAWRMEVMYLNPLVEGFSPLHAALWQPNGKPERQYGCTGFPVPHLSYKPRATAARLSPLNAYVNEIRRLEGLGFDRAQNCESTYGMFSYWHHPSGVVDRQVYLKPRVNLRDREGRA